MIERLLLSWRSILGCVYEASSRGMKYLPTLLLSSDDDDDDFNTTLNLHFQPTGLYLEIDAIDGNSTRSKQSKLFKSTCTCCISTYHLLQMIPSTSKISV